MSMIFHICPQSDWEKAQERGKYLDPSLDEVGFIHCSEYGQLISVANHYYSGATDLLILQIDAEKVLPEIRWEAADGDQFPHIYGPLNLEAVAGVQDFHPDEDGVFRTLPDFK